MSMSVTLPNLTVPYQLTEQDGVYTMSFEVGTLNNAAALIMAIGAGPIFHDLLEVAERTIDAQLEQIVGKPKPSIDHRALLTAVAGMVIGGWSGAADKLVQTMIGCSTKEAIRVAAAVQQALAPTHFMDLNNNVDFDELTRDITINPEA